MLCPPGEHKQHKLQYPSQKATDKIDGANNPTEETPIIASPPIQKIHNTPYIRKKNAKKIKTNRACRQPRPCNTCFRAPAGSIRSLFDDFSDRLGVKSAACSRNLGVLMSSHLPTYLVTWAHGSCSSLVRNPCVQSSSSL